MLSRAALCSSGPLRVLMITRPCSSSSGVPRLIPALTYPSKKAEQNPERDTKNYPRVPRPEKPGATRMFFLPEEWFQFFYSKTGVTGPYAFLGGLTTFLLSKEILVMEHSFYVGLSFGLVVYMGVKLAGPGMKDSINKDLQQSDKSYYDITDSSVKLLKDTVQSETHSQWQAQGQKYLFDAKKELIAVQLEAAFRERQMTVYKAVKSRLDYKQEMDNVKRRYQHQHMVNWIVDNVRKSITPDLEKRTLDQCLVDLKSLAARS